MRKDGALPFRIVFTIVLAGIDFLLLPQFFMIPVHLREGTTNEFRLSFLGWAAAWERVKGIWIWIQPMAAGAVAWIWLAGRSLVNVNPSGDTPQSAGHGQHGTARWQTDKEVDCNFTVHLF
jgi:type IV secretion system protein VirD4